jgi:hypothetical protein
MGDSITRRWGASDAQYQDFLANWNRSFFGWNAANSGSGSDTVQNILWRLANGELDDVHPKVIVLLAGTNNLGGKPPPEGQDARIESGLGRVVVGGIGGAGLAAGAGAQPDDAELLLHVLVILLRCPVQRLRRRAGIGRVGSGPGGRMAQADGQGETGNETGGERAWIHGGCSSNTMTSVNTSQNVKPVLQPPTEEGGRRTEDLTRSAVGGRAENVVAVDYQAVKAAAGNGDGKPAVAAVEEAG